MTLNIKEVAAELRVSENTVMYTSSAFAYNERDPAGVVTTIPGHFTTPYEGVMQNDSTNMAAREWRVIPGFSKYEVSDDGIIRVRGSRKIISLQTSKRGRYKLANIVCDEWERKRWLLVHRAVLAAFVGPCPDGCETRHLNGIGSDNRLSNLAWGTAVENAADRETHGTHQRGSQKKNAKVDEKTVAMIRSARQSGEKFVAIAERFGLTKRHTENICYGYIWKHVKEASCS